MQHLEAFASATSVLASFSSLYVLSLGIRMVRLLLLLFLLVVAVAVVAARAAGVASGKSFSLTSILYPKPVGSDA